MHKNTDEFLISALNHNEFDKKAVNALIVYLF